MSVDYGPCPHAEALRAFEGEWRRDIARMAARERLLQERGNWWKGRARAMAPVVKAARMLTAGIVDIRALTEALDALDSKHGA